jgi:hypothetical protein
MSDESEKKRDLTGILELSALMPPQSQEELLAQDPFAINEMAPVEQVDDFASIESMEMIDHEVPVDEIPMDEPEPEETPTLEAEAPIEDPFDLVTDAPEEVAVPENPFTEDPFAALTPTEPAFVTGIQEYSERSREATFRSSAKSPFHLWMQGKFDPYSRDKLLLFITENPMGLNSSDLDRQINAGRVLLPRISEFAGIKLIQDLRDSGLSFKLAPSSRDEDEILPEVDNLRLAYSADTANSNETALPVFPDQGDPKVWQAFDSIQLVQFLKAEILEVERSELFQDLLARMTVSLKQKAKLRGANAIAEIQHELKPLRLPSQYQIELKATLLKKL